MIDVKKAIVIIKKNLPGSEIKKYISYGGDFIFLVQPPDPDEFPVFFSVNQSTGAFRDFSPFDVEDPVEFQRLFMAKT